MWPLARLIDLDSSRLLFVYAVSTRQAAEHVVSRELRHNPWVRRDCRDSPPFCESTLWRSIALHFAHFLTARGLISHDTRRAECRDRPALLVRAHLAQVLEDVLTS